MAIDWESIEGYSEDMSAEDKLALLDKQETNPATTAPTDAPKDAPPTNEQKPDPAPAASKAGEKTIAKSQFDKLASELAAAKKQLRAKMSEDEAKELDRQQEWEEKEQELTALRKEKTLSTYKASFLALGYDEQLASETADALTESDMDAVFANMKKHTANAEKALRAKILKETPVPPAGNNVEEKDKDPFIEAFKKG